MITLAESDFSATRDVDSREVTVSYSGLVDTNKFKMEYDNTEVGDTVEVTITAAEGYTINGIVSPITVTIS